MCDTGPIRYREKVKCSSCGKSPAFYLDDDSISEDQEAHCRNCGISLFGSDVMAVLEYESDEEDNEVLEV